MIKPLSLKGAFALGRQHGEDIAREVIAAGVNISGTLTEITGEDNVVPYLDALAVVSAGELADAFHEAVATADEHRRQYSPFEVYAAALNARRDPESGWSAYESGFERGVRVALRAAGLAVLL